MAGDMAEEYTFFLEQYNKAKSEEDRDAANSAAHRFSLTTECKYLLLNAYYSLVCIYGIIS